MKIHKALLVAFLSGNLAAVAAPLPGPPADTSSQGPSINTMPSPDPKPASKNPFDIPLPPGQITVQKGPRSARGAGSADEVEVDKVTGQAWFEPEGDPHDEKLSSKEEVSRGTLITDVDGSIYGTPAPGNSFRIGPDTVVKVEGNEAPKTAKEKDEVFDLYQGKMTSNIAPKAQAEDQFDLSGGKVSFKQGLCVICIHGDGAHIYVAKGNVTLFPTEGKYKTTGIRLEAKAAVGIMGNRGQLAVQPLNTVAPGTHNCLMSGVSPEIVQRLEEATPNPKNTPVNPPVSAVVSNQ